MTSPPIRQTKSSYNSRVNFTHKPYLLLRTVSYIAWQQPQICQPVCVCQWQVCFANMCLDSSFNNVRHLHLRPESVKRLINKLIQLLMRRQRHWKSNATKLQSVLCFILLCWIPEPIFYWCQTTLGRSWTVEMPTDLFIGKTTLFWPGNVIALFQRPMQLPTCILLNISSAKYAINIPLHFISLVLLTVYCPSRSQLLLLTFPFIFGILSSLLVLKQFAWYAVQPEF